MTSHSPSSHLHHHRFFQLQLFSSPACKLQGPQSIIPHCSYCLSHFVSVLRSAESFTHSCPCGFKLQQSCLAQATAYTHSFNTDRLRSDKCLRLKAVQESELETICSVLVCVISASRMKVE